MDELLARQRKEKRELQARITQKKKGATKKTRKGVNDECEALERELASRHAQEVAALGGEVDKSEDIADGDANEMNEPQNTEQDTPVNKEPPISSTDQIATAVSNLTMSSTVPNDADTASQSLHRKPNRNKARLARRAAEREALADEAAQEADHMPDLKAREKESMIKEFERRGLKEKEIRADGHCLYSAFAYGLKAQEIGLEPRIELLQGGAGAGLRPLEDYRFVRRVAASYMSHHPDDFVPFLEEPLEQYINKVSNTGEWGGQLELLALARAYGVNINVVQGDGRVEEIHGEGDDRKQLWLAYYKHNFGLGEHYNSLSKEPGNP